VAGAGHETGVHTYDHIRWQDFVAKRGEVWTRKEFDRALAAYHEVFREGPHTHGAAGWQMNEFAYRLEQRAGFRYVSDTRGTGPFRPVLDGQTLDCVQLPTTLPTLDELIGLDGLTPDNVHERVLADSRVEAEHGHVYTLHAELEGMKLLPVMERLLTAWTSEGFEIGAMDDLYSGLKPNALARHRLDVGTVPGRSGTLAVQGERLNADA